MDALVLVAKHAGKFCEGRVSEDQCAGPCSEGRRAFKSAGPQALHTEQFRSGGSQEGVRTIGLNHQVSGGPEQTLV